MSKTLRNTVSEVYKKKNNTNYGINNNVVEKFNINTSNSIPINNNNTLNNSKKSVKLNTNNVNSKLSTQNNNSAQKTTSYFSFLSILGLLFPILIFLVLIIGGLFLYKDQIISYIQLNLFGNELTKKEDEIVNLKKELEQNRQEQKMIEDELNKLKSSNKNKQSESSTNEKMDNNDDKQNKVEKNSKEVSASAKQERNKELSKIYSDNQFVKEDGFCYIGTDDNMRQCVQVYQGDICESGDIYKRIDKCLLPTHFSN